MRAAATSAAATAGTRATFAARTRRHRLLTESYPEDEFLADLIRVTGGETDERWRAWSSSESAECPAWMRQLGVRFQSSLRGTLHLARTNAFFLGGGKALMNSYYAAAERLGVRVRTTPRSSASISTDGSVRRGRRWSTDAQRRP